MSPETREKHAIPDLGCHADVLFGAAFDRPVDAYAADYLSLAAALRSANRTPIGDLGLELGLGALVRDLEAIQHK